MVRLARRRSRHAWLWAALCAAAGACGRGSEPVRVESGDVALEAALDSAVPRVGGNRLELDAPRQDGAPARGRGGRGGRAHALDGGHARDGQAPSRSARAATGATRRSSTSRWEAPGSSRSWRGRRRGRRSGRRARSPRGRRGSRSEGPGRRGGGAPGQGRRARGTKGTQRGRRRRRLRPRAAGEAPGEFTLPPARVQEVGVRLGPRSSAGASREASAPRASSPTTRRPSSTCRSRCAAGSARSGRTPSACASSAARRSSRSTAPSSTPRRRSTSRRSRSQRRRARQRRPRPRRLARARGAQAPARSGTSAPARSRRSSGAARRSGDRRSARPSAARCREGGRRGQRLRARRSASTGSRRSTASGSRREVYESGAAPVVRVGMPATVTLPYLPGQRLRGARRLRLPDASTRATRTRARAPRARESASGALRPDMYATVRLEGDAADAARRPAVGGAPRRRAQLRVPRSRRGRFRPRQVEVGHAERRGRSRSLAASRPGERVVRRAPSWSRPRAGCAPRWSSGDAAAPVPAPTSRRAPSRRLIAACARQPVLDLLARRGRVALGGVASRCAQTPLDAIPDLSDMQVIVFTEWPGREPGPRRGPDHLPDLVARCSRRRACASVRGAVVLRALVRLRRSSRTAPTSTGRAAACSST